MILECTQLRVCFLACGELPCVIMDWRADVPRWRQLADLIVSRVAAGEYKPGQSIPSEHTLVQETGLSRSTVQKTLKYLRNQGVIYSVHGLGNFVSGNQGGESNR